MARDPSSGEVRGEPVSRSPDFWRVAYFLSRCGGEAPPSELVAPTWSRAYMMFFDALADGRSERAFRNSLKNARDHFDGHLGAPRRGWREGNAPKDLGDAPSRIVAEWADRSDDELWRSVRALTLPTLPERVPSMALHSARRANPPRVVSVPVEAANVEAGERRTPQEALVFRRREAALVERFRRFMAGRGVEYIRHCITPEPGTRLYSDLYDAERNVLVEAKGDAARESLRMALGQLLDYARFIAPRPRLAVLLPDRPTLDLQALLLANGVDVIWEERAAFIFTTAGENAPVIHRPAR